MNGPTDRTPGRACEWAGIYRALEAANGQDVKVGGGVAAIREFLRARLIDEMHIVIAPVLLGAGQEPVCGHRHASAHRQEAT